MKEKALQAKAKPACKTRTIVSAFRQITDSNATQFKLFTYDEPSLNIFLIHFTSKRMMVAFSLFLKASTEAREERKKRLRINRIAMLKPRNCVRLKVFTN
ncbi:CLUMA_CG017317, isoform A [Clunio marinus]|uniref:CLUMA_CG017317, isoform A n=1 Tax=Clunio marinus TaxID=568069 RepID=A0A1J1IVR8_9DIPT|nr:CLUMA_CG017317, isoform A [Clunio marinus]